MTTLIKETEFFNLYTLSDGVYAAISIPGRGAWSNAGIVDLGDELLVFDSFTTPSAGRELRRQAELLTGKKVKYLINSHYHGDHVFGNQAFYDVSILSTSLTREWCKEKNKLDDVEIEIKETKEYLNNLQNQINLIQNPIIKASLMNQYNEMSKVLEDLPDMQIVLPAVIFEEKLIIEGSKRKVELHCLGGGHTPSDTFMYLPEDKIAFMGDLVTQDLHVPIYHPEDFSYILKEVKEMEIELFVPGHGNVGNEELLEKIAGYVAFLIEKSKEAVENKVSLESFTSEFETPPEYKKWKGVNGIRDNLSKVYRFYAK
ncbi:MBL fold metallo-hydrolase [Rossellomorea oryzaecorticis]|uniref:MBL fold metallo-hydrolase n=1 Tax=Rossellomorea oryzaecorticis TaxID=1396505 RepID=A0ABU9KF77_9BACI